MTKPRAFFTIDAIGKGFLAVSAHPAQCGNAAMMIRDMAAGEVRQVVSLLQPGESRELGLENEAALVNAQSMEFVSFPLQTWDCRNLSMISPGCHCSCFIR